MNDGAKNILVIFLKISFFLIFYQIWEPVSGWIFHLTWKFLFLPLNNDLTIILCRACLRLLVSYIEHIYPSPTPTNAVEGEVGPAVKHVVETQRLAECVYEVRTLLVTMLRDGYLQK